MGDASGIFIGSVLVALVLRVPLILLEGGLKLVVFSRFANARRAEVLRSVVGVVILETLASIVFVGGIGFLDHTGRISGAIVVSRPVLLSAWLLSVGLLAATVWLVNLIFLRRVCERHLPLPSTRALAARSLLMVGLFFATSGLQDLWAYLSTLLGLFPVGS
ncbi:hypothetical protein AMJ71_07740 [candidate division TA06 bacterium SM1_40]|uniref:Uncharacterized protein n=2 Tax=Bacteria division TA06 TaxID=1156500 RepID=A0A0S8JGU7_UNCT6|nr:MAG: hypothetical protein AMJ82_11055 [candidate division TA06 bacterium SM23_40]KPL08945.1 MAG: hypothetical protein AMJ71_07740 [candidate division TA06 bacterium SM1_40]